MQRRSFSPLVIAAARLARMLTGHRSGSVAVETAFVLPMLLLLLFGIMETGHLLWTVTALNQAVEDGARFASIQPLPICGDPTAVQNYAATRAWGLSLAPSIFTLSQPTDNCGCQVSANLNFQPFVGLIPYSMALNPSVCIPHWPST